MLWDFWRAALLFHGILGSVVVALIVRRAARSRGSRGVGVADLFADTFLFGTALVIAAALAGSLAPYAFFATARFLCQGLFGEGVLLSLSLILLAARRGSPKALFVAALTTLALVAVYWAAYRHGPRDLRIEHHTVNAAGRSGALGRLRILHLSDLQTDRIGPYEEAALRRTGALNPDLILFTGDYIQERLALNRRKGLADLRALLQRTLPRAPLGAFALEGDVERNAVARSARSTAEWQEPFRAAGVRCLMDESVRLRLPRGVTLTLVGLRCDTSRSRDEESPLQVLDGAPSGDLTIIAGHAPDFAAHLVGRRVALLLAGHTHGGQVVLPFFGPPITLSRLPRRYAGGLNDYQGLPLHVSRGIGMERGVAAQVRFNCPPEICLIEVRY